MILKKNTTCTAYTKKHNFQQRLICTQGSSPGTLWIPVRPKRRRWRWRLAATCAAISRTSPRSRRKRPGRMAFWRPGPGRWKGWQSWHQGGSLNNLPSQMSLGWFWWDPAWEYNKGFLWSCELKKDREVCADMIPEILPTLLLLYYSYIFIVYCLYPRANWLIVMHWYAA